MHAIWAVICFVGCTDSSSEITMRPQPTEKEIQFILDAISEYLTVKVRPAVGHSGMHSTTPGCTMADLLLLPNLFDGCCTTQHVQQGLL